MASPECAGQLELDRTCQAAFSDDDRSPYVSLSL